MKKVAVVLSGCGFLDGAEITESVSALIALSEKNAEYACFAPNMTVPETDHISRESTDLSRNTLRESARISRGEVQDLKDLQESDFDALVLPGGFGAAKNLSNFASQGAGADVHPEVSRVIRSFHQAAKPIGAICIAPALIAKVLGSEGVSLTIGEDPGTAEEIEKTGAQHVKCSVTEYVSDRDHKILTTPAYMFDDAKPSDVFAGVRKMIHELVEMA